MLGSSIVILTTLFPCNSDIFTNDRLMVAVTKFDTNVADDPMLSYTKLEEKVKEVVADFIEDAIKVVPSQEIIVPVSGLASYCARYLLSHDKRDDEYTTIKEKATRLYRDYSISQSKPSGQGEGPIEHLHCLPDDASARKLAEEFEKSCGILKLERRYCVYM